MWGGILYPSRPAAHDYRNFRFHVVGWLVSLDQVRRRELCGCGKQARVVLRRATAPWSNVDFQIPEETITIRFS